MESPVPLSQSVQVEARPPPPAPPGFARRPTPMAAVGEEDGESWGLGLGCLGSARGGRDGDGDGTGNQSFVRTGRDGDGDGDGTGILLIWSTSID
jgi:hypothetical protein